MTGDRDTLAARVAAVQGPILEGARSTFTDNELGCLRGLVRLVVEFQDYLASGHGDTDEPDQLQYLSGSVFGGVDSFASVAAAYRVLVGATPSTIKWTDISKFGSRSIFRERYLALYQEFAERTEFELRCRVLLDLFKLQLVFVGLLYTW